MAKTEALLLVMVLAGEEIPDHLQKLAAEHPDTDPFLAALNRYHRMEEARHLSFARTVLPEAWARAGWIERQRIRLGAPFMIDQLWQAFVHPGVYTTVGLPTWKTWKAVQRLPRRIELRKTVTRPVLEALLDAGAFRRGRVPRGWRRLCGVDRHGVAARLTTPRARAGSTPPAQRSSSVSPAAIVAPRSQQASRSAALGSPITTTGFARARHCNPVVIVSIARSAPVVSLLPCRYTP